MALIVVLAIPARKANLKISCAFQSLSATGKAPYQVAARETFEGVSRRNTDGCQDGARRGQIRKKCAKENARPGARPKIQKRRQVIPNGAHSAVALGLTNAKSRNQLWRCRSTLPPGRRLWPNPHALPMAKLSLGVPSLSKPAQTVNLATADAF